MLDRPHATVSFALAMLLVVAGVFAANLLAEGASEPIRPVENPDAEQAAANARMPDGFRMQLFAAEPMLENPVALDIDEQGRVFIAETHRLHRGVSDNRNSGFWLDDDLAAMTVEDRAAYQEEWAERGEWPHEWYTDHAERVRLLVDESGDGRADASYIFADGFNDPLHGLASGVLAFEGDIYLANIPHLYLLRDTTGDNHADEQNVLHRGYGIRTAFLAHDLHGLMLGPDGRLYFSLGDRGYHVETEDGRTLVDPLDPGRGAIFRCDLDGSNLEVIYYGLRNPQDLAFDKYGNLFTGDNDADGIDRSRVVYLLEGGDAGWSMTFQYMGQRGPWERERLWETENDDQPAWALPPLAYLAAGPSGFEYNPGAAALPPEYDDHFFLVDFRGNPANSGVHAFSVEQDGAAFEVINPHEFIWNALVTDITFGYDGKLYLTDWEGGWGIQDPPVGRVYTAWHEPSMDDPAIAELGELIRESFGDLANDRLGQLLHHADMRIRLRAQYALAQRIGNGDDPHASILAPLVADEGLDFLPARLHAVWAMGQALRHGHTDVLGDLLDRLQDIDANVRAQTAKMIGDALAGPGAADPAAVRSELEAYDGVARLIALLDDESLHVQALTAIALGKLGDPAAFEPLMQRLHENDDQDRYLRHALVMGIHGVADADTLVERSTTASAPQRLGIVLALRRDQDGRLARFLDDEQMHIVYEAAVAIFDLDITDAMPALAEQLERYTQQASPGQDRPTFERAFFRGISGDSLDNLRNAEAFPDEPDEVDHSTTLSIPADADDNYGTRITGHVTPPQSGAYVFHLSGDNSAALYLSTDAEPDNKRRIAAAPQWTGRHEYDKFDEQISEPIELEAGQTYYIEVMHKAGGGNDHLDVAWLRPDGELEQPIGGGISDVPEALLRRAINANLALGGYEHAQRVARYAADATQPDAMRAEALSVLELWADPPLRDRVNNYHRPQPTRDAEIAREALEPVMVTIVDTSAGQLQSQATDLATELGLGLDEDTLFARLSDAAQGDDARLAVLRSLVSNNSPRAREAIGKAIESDSPRLRAEGRRMLAQRDAAAGFRALTEALEEGEAIEQQLALAAMGELEHDGADDILAEWLDDMLSGNVRRPLQLDLVEAAEQRSSSRVRERLGAYQASLDEDDPLAPFAIALRGGDAEAGRRTFFSHPAAQCIRCHSIDGSGGDAAPDLTGVGSRRSRSQLLADLLTPNESVAEGFGTIVLTLEDGDTVVGTLREETDEQFTVLTLDGQVREVPAADVAVQTPPVSAMPSMQGVLTPRELRDVIEYLATHEE